jgi:hypothetical protein
MRFFSYLFQKQTHVLPSIERIKTPIPSPQHISTSYDFTSRIQAPNESYISQSFQVQEVVKDMAKDMVKEMLKETVQDAVKEPVKYIEKEPVKETVVAKDTVSEPTLEAVQENIVYQFDESKLKEVTFDYDFDVEINSIEIDSRTKDEIMNISDNELHESIRKFLDELFGTK